MYTYLNYSTFRGYRVFLMVVKEFHDNAVIVSRRNVFFSPKQIVGEFIVRVKLYQQLTEMVA